MIPFLHHSEKGKTIGMKNGLVVTGCSGERPEKGTQRSLGCDGNIPYLAVVVIAYQGLDAYVKICSTVHF